MLIVCFVGNEFSNLNSQVTNKRQTIKKIRTILLAKQYASVFCGKIEQTEQERRVPAMSN